MTVKSYRPGHSPYRKKKKQLQQQQQEQEQQMQAMSYRPSNNNNNNNNNNNSNSNYSKSSRKSMGEQEYQRTLSSFISTPGMMDSYPTSIQEMVIAASATEEHEVCLNEDEDDNNNTVNDNVNDISAISGGPDGSIVGLRNVADSADADNSWMHPDEESGVSSGGGGADVSFGLGASPKPRSSSIRNHSLLGNGSNSGSGSGGSGSGSGPSGSAGMGFLGWINSESSSETADPYGDIARGITKDEDLVEVALVNAGEDSDDALPPDSVALDADAGRPSALDASGSGAAKNYRHRERSYGGNGNDFRSPRYRNAGTAGTAANNNRRHGYDGGGGNDESDGDEAVSPLNETQDLRSDRGGGSAASSTDFFFNRPKLSKYLFVSSLVLVFCSLGLAAAGLGMMFAAENAEKGGTGGEGSSREVVLGQLQELDKRGDGDGAVDLDAEATAEVAVDVEPGFMDIMSFPTVLVMEDDDNMVLTMDVNIDDDTMVSNSTGPKGRLSTTTTSTTAAPQIAVLALEEDEPMIDVLPIGTTSATTTPTVEATTDGNNLEQTDLDFDSIAAEDEISGEPPVIAADATTTAEATSTATGATEVGINGTEANATIIVETAIAMNDAAEVAGIAQEASESTSSTVATTAEAPENTNATAEEALVPRGPTKSPSEEPTMPPSFYPTVTTEWPSYFPTRSPTLEITEAPEEEVVASNNATTNSTEVPATTTNDEEAPEATIVNNGTEVSNITSTTTEATMMTNNNSSSTSSPSSTSTATTATTEEATTTTTTTTSVGEEGLPSLAIQTIADTWLEYNDTRSYGDKKRLKVDGMDPRATILKFNMTQLSEEFAALSAAAVESSGAIAITDDDVIGVGLRLYSLTDGPFGGKIDILDESCSDWDEYDLSWDNAPACMMSPNLVKLGEFGNIIREYRWNEAALNYGGNNILDLLGQGLITLRVTSHYADGVTYASRENETAVPELVVYYTLPVSDEVVEEEEEQIIEIEFMSEETGEEVPVNVSAAPSESHAPHDPTRSPSEEPTMEPTPSPSFNPTTHWPSYFPTLSPTINGTVSPTASPSEVPKQLVIPITQDALIRPGASANNIFGLDPFIALRGGRKALLEFDLTELRPQVQYFFTLRFFVTYVAWNEQRSVTASYITQPNFSWDERYITWNNFGQPNTTSVGWFSIYTEDSESSVDIPLGRLDPDLPPPDGKLIFVLENLIDAESIGGAGDKFDFRSREYDEWISPEAAKNTPPTLIATPVFGDDDQ